jgi:type I restriction enzyme S subunit
MSFGKPYILRTAGCIHDGWLVLSPRSSEVDSDYFYCLLGSRSIYKEFERRAAGATVKNLNIDLVKGVLVPFPPLERQQAFAWAESRVEAMRGAFRASLAEIDALFASLQHRAFAAQL